MKKCPYCLTDLQAWHKLFGDVHYCEESETDRKTMAFIRFRGKRENDLPAFTDQEVCTPELEDAIKGFDE